MATVTRRGDRIRPPYLPGRRTALVFTGTGAHGAYHAGVLRAVQEAGVKVDVVAGHGIGAATATLAAIDGGARLWDRGGLWSAPKVAPAYSWSWPLRWAGWLALALGVVLVAPAVVMLLGAIVYGIGFGLEMLGSSLGSAIVGQYSAWVSGAFAGPNLPTTIPRLALFILLAIVVLLLTGFVRARRDGARTRRTRGPGWGWYLLTGPLDTRPMREAVASSVWELIRGAASAEMPGRIALSRRYAEVLTENLGQPGFRELMIAATDLDARRDQVAALLREPHREGFLAPHPDRERNAEVLDIAGSGRDLTFDLVSAALTPGFVADPHPVVFPPDSYWRGETHRLCDRPGAAGRLLTELDAAGVVQLIVVSAVSPVLSPHRLQAPRLDLRSRLGESLVATEAAALHDALDAARPRFDAVYLIAPEHNPVGPFDLGGTYDESSDREHTIDDLLRQGYEDAYRQFIEPVVGASGEQLGAAVEPEP